MSPSTAALFRKMASQAAASKSEGSNQLRVKKLAKSWQIKPRGVARERRAITPRSIFRHCQLAERSQPLGRDRGSAIPSVQQANDK